MVSRRFKGEIGCADHHREDDAEEKIDHVSSEPPVSQIVLSGVGIRRVAQKSTDPYSCSWDADIKHVFDTKVDIAVYFPVPPRIQVVAAPYN